MTDTDMNPPRYHGDPESHESADTQAGDSTNEHLNRASEDQSYSVMHWKPSPHILAENNGESQVREVDEHGQHRRICGG